MLTNFFKAVYSTENGQSSYKFSFQVDRDTDVRVLVVDPSDLEPVPLFLGLDYLVAGVGNADGGSIELTATGMRKAGSGFKITIKRGEAHQYQMPTPSGEIGADLSEDEVAVGIDYTDGNRVIYQKTISLGALPGGTSSAQADKHTPHNITGMRRYWIERAWSSSGSGVIPLPLAHAAPQQILISMGDTIEVI